MKRRQAKKIVAVYGGWKPVDDKFTVTGIKGVKVDYFTCGCRRWDKDKKVLQMISKKFGFPYVYAILPSPSYPMPIRGVTI